MGKIKASLSGVKTELPLIEPGTYVWNIEKDEERNNGDVHLMYSKIVQAEDNPEMLGRVYVEYINLVDKDSGEPNEMGLISLKKYFEAVYGKEETEGWSDEDYDTDRLIGQQFLGQMGTRSYKDKSTGEDKTTNRFKTMQPLA